MEPQNAFELVKGAVAIFLFLVVLIQTVRGFIVKKQIEAQLTRLQQQRDDLELGDDHISSLLRREYFKSSDFWLGEVLTNGVFFCRSTRHSPPGKGAIFPSHLVNVSFRNTKTWVGATIVFTIVTVREIVEDGKQVEIPMSLEVLRAAQRAVEDKQIPLVE